MESNIIKQAFQQEKSKLFILNIFLSSTQMASINVEQINDDYEFIQYNAHLRIIHSIKDDMYQAQSIIIACKSNKQAYRWKQLVETKEIIDELCEQQNCCPDDLIQNRPNIELPQL